MERTSHLPKREIKIAGTEIETKNATTIELADSISSALDEKGIILMDTAEGTNWDVKALFNSSI